MRFVRVTIGKLAVSSLFEPDFIISRAECHDAARFPEAQKRRKRWTRKECVEALARLLAEWPNDRRLTEDAYQEASRSRDDLPSLSSLQRQGGFAKLVSDARKLRS